MHLLTQKEPNRQELRYLPLNLEVRGSRALGVSEGCRRCGAAETIGHIISACPTYGFTLFKDRHDQVLYQVVKAVAKALKVAVPAYLRSPGGKVKPGVLGSRGQRLMVDQLIPTSRDIKERRPDLFVKYGRSQ